MGSNFILGALGAKVWPKIEFEFADLTSHLFQGFWPPWRSPGGQDDPQECCWVPVDTFRHLRNSNLRSGRKVTTFLVHVTKFRTKASYLGICLHFHKVWQKTKVLLTLLPDQLQRPVSTLKKALDLGNAMDTIPRSLLGSKAFKNAKTSSKFGKSLAKMTKVWKPNEQKSI